MNLVSWIIVGLFAGWLTRMVMKGDGLGVVGDIILGIAGVLFASALLGIPNPMNGIDATSIIVAFIGGIIVVTIMRAVGLSVRG